MTTLDERSKDREGLPHTRLHTQQYATAHTALLPASGEHFRERNVRTTLQNTKDHTAPSWSLYVHQQVTRRQCYRSTSDSAATEVQRVVVVVVATAAATTPGSLMTQCREQTAWQQIKI